MTNHRTAKATLKWVRKSASNQKKTETIKKFFVHRNPTNEKPCQRKIYLGIILNAQNDAVVINEVNFPVENMYNHQLKKSH